MPLDRGRSRETGCFISGVDRQTARAGGASRDRTDDLKLAKLALSQLSYGPEPESPSFMPWWAEKELNLRPHAYQACALTT